MAREAAGSSKSSRSKHGPKHGSKHGSKHGKILGRSRNGKFVERELLGRKILGRSKNGKFGEREKNEMKTEIKKLIISYILIGLIVVLALAAMIHSTLANPEYIANTGSISGFIWIDGDGTSETGRDGQTDGSLNNGSFTNGSLSSGNLSNGSLSNGGRQPLAGYTVYLYAVDDLSSVLAVTTTDSDGAYMFANIEPGSYVLGLIAKSVNGNEYCLPTVKTAGNSFHADNGSSMVAYTDIIELEAGEAVDGIDAGMRLVLNEIDESQVPGDDGDVEGEEDGDSAFEADEAGDDGDREGEEDGDSACEADEAGDDGDTGDREGEEDGNFEDMADEAGDTGDITDASEGVNDTDDPEDVSVLDITENGRSRALLPRAAYTIDVNNYDGSLSVPGVGYSYDADQRILVFNTDAYGNIYTITRTGASSGNLTGIKFLPGSSPASVTMIGLNNLSKGIIIPDDFTADLSFKWYGVNKEYCDLGPTTLTLPEGYKGNLNINGLKVATLNFPSDYDLPIILNGLEVTSTLRYPANYAGPITIGGSLVVPNKQQFPADYTGSVIIGDVGGEFTIKQAICRADSSTGSDACIFLPDNISTFTISNAKTSGTGALNIRLGAVDVATGGNPDGFKLLLAGNSVINGEIDIPLSATLTIDSKDHPGSESGRLAISSKLGTAIGSGTIIINGGTVEATGGLCGIGGDSKPVIINGGRVIATCTGDGAAIGSVPGVYSSIANITINGGTVIASALGDGAGIGSGSGAIGGSPGNSTSVGAVIHINGGTVVASGGEVDRLHLGSGSYNGAGIGGGKDTCADITITGGHVTVYSMHGAGIGNGTGGNRNSPRGSIVITGGTIRGYSLDGASIGSGFGNSWLPTYYITKEADILMYRRGYLNDPGALMGWCNTPHGSLNAADGHGDGYFVSIFFDDGYVKGDLYVYQADTNALVKRLPVPDNHPYASILFSTGHPYTENFKIFVDTLNYSGVSKGMKQAVHYYDHLAPLPDGGPSILKLKHNIIPSVTHMNGYEHNFAGSYWHTLYMAFDFGQGNGPDSPDFFNVTETFVDTDGVRIPGKEDKHFVIEKGGTYGGLRNAIDGYDYVGYHLDHWDGTYTPGYISGFSVTGDILVHYVYRAQAGTVNVTISKVVTGHFVNRSKDFTFTVYVTDENDQALDGTIYYEGGTVPGMGATAPLDGVLTLEDGKVTLILKHGQSITLPDVPADAKIRVVESIESGYSPSFVDNAGADGTSNDTGFSVAGIDGVTMRAFDFFNKQNVDPVPTGFVYDFREMELIAVVSVLLLVSVWVAVEVFLRRYAVR